MHHEVPSSQDKKSLMWVLIFCINNDSAKNENKQCISTAE